MSVELDHLFICTDVGAPAAERLRDLGLTEGSPNRHPGQGTACRRFFFPNAMLELLWVEEPGEAQAEVVARTRLWERWAGRHGVASPFGVCLRPGPSGGTAAPFDAWPFRPPYLPEGLAFGVADGTPLTEPMWVHLPFARPQDQAPPERRQPMEHRLGIRLVTRVRLCGPVTAWSDAARRVREAGVLELETEPEHRLEIEWDGGQQGREADLRPELPLVLRW